MRVLHQRRLDPLRASCATLPSTPSLPALTACSPIPLSQFFRDMHKNEGRDQAIGADRKIEGIVRPGDQKPTDKV